MDAERAPTPYELLGGDAKVRELVERFYDLMDLEPGYRELQRDQWMACMVQAMEEVDIPQELRDVLEQAFYKTADWMRNKPG